jgi:CRP/FNR family transcriptional regulator, dissimilatory nitrate respiration regulator
MFRSGRATAEASGDLLVTFTATSPFADLFPGSPPTKIVAAGDTLFRQGDPAEAIYFVESGCLRLERTTPSGTLVVLHSARAGELLAEGALAASHYHCNAVAKLPSRVQVYAKADILSHLPPGSVGFGLATVLARHLIRARQRIELRDIRSARERVLQFLRQHADCRGHVAIQRELQDIAAELGLSREALYRTLAALQKEKRIERHAGCILLTTA